MTDKEVNEIVVQNIKLLRKFLGITQKQMAGVLGMKSETTYRMKELSRRLFSISEVIKAYNYFTSNVPNFNITLQEFMTVGYTITTSTPTITPTETAK